MPEAKGYSKEQQVGAGRPKRYRRKVASPKQWQAIVADKGAECRAADPGIVCDGHIEYHHIVNRSQGGDDVADNIMPLCRKHHFYVTGGNQNVRAVVAERLTEGEYAYCIEKLGEAAMERLFGVYGQERP